MAPTRTEPARTDGTGVRAVGVIGLLVATGIHVVVGLPPNSTLQVLFLLSGVGTLAGAVLLLVRPRLGWIVGGGVSLLTALGYVLRSTVGLPPLISNPVPFTRPPSGAVCTVVEIVVGLLAIWVLADRSARTADRGHAGRPAG